MGENIHSPFLYNLYMCCGGGDYYDFSAMIDEIVKRQTNEILREVFKLLEEVSYDKEGQSVLPNTFNNFVMKMAQWEKGSLPPYCLFGFYLEISRLFQYLNKSLHKNHSIPKSDLNVIRKFQKLRDNFEENNVSAVNEKRLRDLMSGIRDRKELKGTKRKLFDFLLKEVFPEYSSAREGLIELLRWKTWDDVAFGDLNYNIGMKNIIKSNRLYKDGGNLFVQLCNLESNNIEEIRKKLVEISNILDKIYAFEEEEKKLNTDRCMIEYDKTSKDSELHSHILCFMQWIPIISEAGCNQQMMEAVDNVIYQIRDQIWEAAKMDSDLVKQLKQYPKEYCCDIFLQDNSVSLRKLLIRAMHKEPYIYSQFLAFYGNGGI